MHPQRAGVMLGFFLLTLLDIASFVDGKAFRGDKGNYDYHFKQELGSQHQPFYRRQSLLPKTNLYYTPHVKGQPIFIPAISGSASHTDNLLDDYYERYKEYTQSWTLATPVTYNYDHENQRDYDEDPVTSKSMVKNHLDDTYQGGVYHSNYHILPTRESNLNHVTKQTENNKINIQNLPKKDKKKNVKDFLDLSTKNLVSVNYVTKPVVSKGHSSEVPEVINKKLPAVDYAPEVVEVVATKLSAADDDDYAPEVVEIIGTKLSDDDDYAPEVVKVIGTKLSDDGHTPGKAEVFKEKLPHEDYAPQVMEVINTELSDKDLDPEVVEVIGGAFPDDDYAPKVMEVINTELSDKDLDPEVVEVIGGAFPADDYAPEVVEVIHKKLPRDNYGLEMVEVVNTKNHGRKKPYPPSSKTELFWKNIVGKDSDETTHKESFKSKEDKMKIKSDKKVLKQSSKSNNKTEDNEEIEFVTKMSDKKKNKNQSLFTEERKTTGKHSSEHLKTVTTKPYLRPATENFEFKKAYETKIKSDKRAVKKPSSSSSKTEDYEGIESVTKKLNNNKESSQKIGIESDIKHVSDDDSIADEKRKVIKWKYEFIDDSESPLVGDKKTKRSSLENIETFSGHSFHEISSEKLGLGTHGALSKEPLNAERFEAFDLENTGSGEPEGENDENIRSGPQFFHNTNSIRSLSSLNSNIWSLVFNPNAELKKSKKCVTRSNETGFCMYLQQCDMPNIITSLEELLSNSCVIDDVFIGICCPEFPVHTVKVNWEQMPSTFGEHAKDEIGHNAEDCGIRSEEASKDHSWPWKAPLVSLSNGKIFCGGVIINEDYILTAAHCTTKVPRNQILVRLGQHDDFSGEDFAVVEIKRHAQYNPRTLHNDIALLKLGRRIVRDEQTDAACLPGGGGGDDDDDDDNEEEDDKVKEDDHAGERAVLLGWKRSFSKKSVKDEILEVLTNEECEKRLGVKVPPTFLCTEARKEDERTCNADSGAPLVIEKDDKYKVIGILSWNRDDCDQRFPSTFSRVSKYVQWIKKHAV